MITFTSKGSFQRTEKYLKRLSTGEIYRNLSKYAQEGVDALAEATPADTGRTASSWSYEISKKGSRWQITWKNSDNEDGFPVAIMLQYGYGTGTGGYVRGRDYINPVIQPIFDRIAEDVWREVTRA